MATLDLTADAYLIRMPTALRMNDTFASRFDYRYQGRAVVCKETSPGTWAVSTHPGVSTTVAGGDSAIAGENDLNSADYVFFGGNIYSVSDANLITALTTEGYPVS